jgi:hypothetical protein
MVTTPELIRLLAADAAPVRRLPPPPLRAGVWLVFASALLAIVAFSFGLRPDLGAKLREPMFVIEIASALLAGIAAAFAAFQLSLPDRSALWAGLPAPALVAWLSSVGYVCLTNWATLGPEGVTLGGTLRCLRTVALVSTPLVLVLLFMLRHARSIRPTTTAIIGALAVAALTTAALRLFHELDATVLVVGWSLGITLSFVGVASVAGRRLFTLIGQPRHS